MSNPPAFKTKPESRVALEAQKRAFEDWVPFGTGKFVMFFPTFTDPDVVPKKPKGAIVVGSLDKEPGMFWVHDTIGKMAVKKSLADGSWYKYLGIVHPMTEGNEHEFTKVVVAFDPITGEEWEAIFAKDTPWALQLQYYELQRQFPQAVVLTMDVKQYKARSCHEGKKGS